MTCREKLALEHPECVGSEYIAGCEGCPSDYGYMSDPKICGEQTISESLCKRCWDRIIPDTKKSERNYIIGKPIDRVTIVARDVNGKREVYEFDSWDAVDVSGKDESEEILLILVGDICIYSKLAHTWIPWDVVSGFFA